MEHHDLRVLDSLCLSMGRAALLVGTHTRESSDSIYAEGRCDDGASVLSWAVIGLATAGLIFEKAGFERREPVRAVRTTLFDGDERGDHAGYACPHASHLYSVVDGNLTIVSGGLPASVPGTARFLQSERAQLVVVRRQVCDDVEVWADRLQAVAQAANVAMLGVMAVDPGQLTQLVVAETRPLGVSQAGPLIIAQPLDPLDDDVEMLREVGWCPARGELLICENAGTKPRRLAAYTVDEDGIWWAPTTSRPGHDEPVSDDGN